MVLLGEGKGRFLQIPKEMSERQIMASIIHLLLWVYWANGTFLTWVSDLRLFHTENMEISVGRHPEIL